MTIEEIVENLRDPSGRISPKQLDEERMDCSGIYAIFVKEPTTLPKPFRSELGKRNHQFLYIGKTSETLKERLVRKDLRHKGSSSFFRSLGAILGYQPPDGSLIGKKNQNNYKFSRKDTEDITNWINKNVMVKWIEMPGNDAKEKEPKVIESIQPLLNIKNNPAVLEELRSVRTKCLEIARPHEGGR